MGPRINTSGVSFPGDEPSVEPVEVEVPEVTPEEEVLDFGLSDGSKGGESKSLGNSSSRSVNKTAKT